MSQTTPRPIAAPAARTRVRPPRALEMNVAAAAPVATMTTTKPIPESWQELAKTYFFQNKVMNAAKGWSEKAREALYAAMAQEKVKSFSFETTTPDGKPATLDVALETPVGQYIDTKTLFELVGQEKALEIMTASAKAVEEAVGGNIKVQCLRSAPGKENVKVKLHGEK